MIRKTLFILAAFSLLATAAFAEDGAASGDKFSSIAAAIAIGIAVFGGAAGQGKAASAALEGIARNPTAQGKIFVPMIISLALIESLVLLAFVIAFIKIKT